MTVWVDDMARPARVGRNLGHWSHLFADTHDELVAFARKLGLRREWIQHEGTHREHFDVTSMVRRKALDYGAQPISYPRGTAELMARKRAAASTTTPMEAPQ